MIMWAKKAIQDTAWLCKTYVFFHILCTMYIYSNKWGCWLQYPDSCSYITVNVMRNTKPGHTVYEYWHQVSFSVLTGWRLLQAFVTGCIRSLLVRQMNYLSELDKKNKTMREEQGKKAPLRASVMFSETMQPSRHTEKMLSETNC